MIAALLLAVQTPPAAGQSSNDQEWAQQVPHAMDTWKLCVVGSARRWAGQTAEPSDVAEGAIGHCAGLLVEVEQALRSSPYLERADVDRLVVKLKSTWRERAVATVMEERAKPRPRRTR